MAPNLVLISWTTFVFGFPEMLVGQWNEFPTLHVGINL